MYAINQFLLCIGKGSDEHPNYRKFYEVMYGKVLSKGPQKSY